MTTRSANGLNQAALAVCEQARANAGRLGIRYQQLPCGANLLDFGVETPGGLAAGLELARITLGNQAEVAIVSGDREIHHGPWVQVSTDHPLSACMFSQYAGWPVKLEKFFAMGSGPMRSRRGREEILTEFSAHDATSLAVGSLECDQLPDCKVAEMIADECEVLPAELWLAVAPTRSLAGCVQVVARSIETTLHKMHAVGMDLKMVHSGYGIAPLPPPTPDFALGIGRTNDSILYGGSVTLWMDGDDSDLQKLGPKLPSKSSCDFGLPFAEVFKRYEYDFYKVDRDCSAPHQLPWSI